MRTHRIGTWEIDADKLAAEMELTRSFTFTESYPEFVAGRLSKEVMLWTPGGETGDSVIAHYDRDLPSAPTEWGMRLPYLMQLVEQHLDVSRICFMRLAVLSNMVHVPHRDYLEFETGATGQARPAHRLHVPLVTDEHCLFLEENTVYRMRFGESWFLDASREHSSAVLADTVRSHLIVDFVDTEDTSLLVLAGSDPSVGIPPENLLARPPLPDSARQGLLSLATIADRDNLADLFGVIAKKVYRFDCGIGFFWNTVAEIARRLPDPELADYVAGLPDYFMLARSE